MIGDKTVKTREQEKIDSLERELEQLRSDYINFAYIVSHDLSAPLRHIEGFANIVLEQHQGVLDEKTLRHLGFIVQGASNATAMLAGLLEYSRLNTRINPFSKIETAQLVDDILLRLDPLVRGAGAKVHIGALPDIIGDEAQIEKVFYNVLHNALHYQKPGAIPIVSLTCKAKDQHYEFEIRDNGIGVKPALSSKIFNVLFRGVLSEEYEGVGMGLAIADKVVSRHGGRMWAHSKPGEGMCLCFTLASRQQGV